MFNAIAFRNAHAPEPLLDIGAIAEALIFYGHVSIIANTATLKALLRGIPPFVVLSLVESGRLRLYYLSDQVAIATNTQENGQQLHSLTGFSSPQHTIETAVAKAFFEATGRTSQGKIGANRLRRNTNPLDHKSFQQHAVIRALIDVESTTHSLHRFAEFVAPDYAASRPIRFRVFAEDENRLVVESNIDFKAINAEYHRIVPESHSTLTEAHLLSLIQGAHEGLHFAAQLETEVAFSSVEQAIEVGLMDALATRMTTNAERIAGFCDLTLDDSRGIREAINAGLVSFIDVVRLLDRADRFREWLKNQPPDADLIKEYLRAVTAETWADKLPVKVARWLLFGVGAGIGVDGFSAGKLGTALGGTIGALDTFLIERLLQGWKPHHFVKRDLRPLFSRIGPGTLDASKPKR